MKYILSVLTLSTALTAGSLAYAADSETNTEVDVKKTANGGYEATVKTESETAAGTAKTSESTVDMDVKNDGRVHKTVKSHSASDPKGLMNKKTKDTETEYTEKANGGYKQVTSTKSKDANGTNVTLVTTTDVDIDGRGNVTTTAKTEKTIDPKGLLNETTTTSETKTVNGKVVKQIKKID